ncbi:MAG: DUF1080 domain-containing protein [Bryobacterales bacterium]|nr:DUF1080 domain-containing protein [Bryobacterales bacterium]
MKTHLGILLAITAALAGIAVAQQRIVLFDGKDLSAWQPAKNWVIQNGELALVNSTDGHEHNDNYLYTKEKFGDFVLDLEFRMAPETNSGVFLRTSDTNDPVQTGIEVQVGLADPSRPLTMNSIGAIYALAIPRSNPAKLADWNHYRITCNGGSIRVELNGVLVSEADLDLFVTAGLNPDGKKNKFSRALKDFARTGYIGLQDHGTPVWYRNITVQRLN